MHVRFGSASRHSRVLCALAGLVIALGLPALAGAQAFELGVRVDLPVGAYPASVAVADLNDDGIPDLVSTNAFDVFGSIWLGLGGGAYAPRVDFPTGGNPLFVTAADFNGDGRQDFVTSNFDSGTLSVLLGNGAGGLGPKVDLTAEFRPRSIAVADVNGDNRLDLVVPNYGAGNLSVFLGNGSGGFAPRTNYGSLSGPTSVATPDLNGDGWPDLVVTNHGGTTISVLLANGGGGFAAQTNYTVGSGGSNPHWLASGDLNNDGIPDVAVADYGSSQISILLGNGTGGFQPRTDYGATAVPATIALVDMNADGIADVVTVDTGGSVSVYAGNGSGGIGSATTVAVGSGPYQATPADLNGDGRVDIVTTNNLSNSLSVLLARGEFGPKSDFATGAAPNGVAMGDVSGDGRPDLAVANGSSSTVSVLLGTGGGGFGPKTDFATGATPNWVAIGDVSGDGRPDLAVANYYSYTVSVLLGTGGGGFGPKTDFATGSNPRSVAIGDVNGDDWPDLAVANGNAHTVSVLLSTGGGGFAPKTDFATGTSPYSVAIGDVSGDGWPDLVVANAGASTVSVLLGTGGGGFGPKTDFATGNAPYSVAIGDVSGDGRPDLAVASYGAGTVSVLLGTGSGGFGPRTDFPSGVNPTSVAIGDVSGDGQPDLTVTNYYSYTVSVLLGLVPTRITLTCSPGLAELGAPITLTATVSVPAPGAGIPTGTVRFFDGTTLLGASPVNGGVAALALFAPRLGARSLTAVYSGDAKYSGSIAAPVMQQVVSSASALVTGIVDVPNDQGYQVRMTFNASSFDYLGSPTPIASYLVYRRIDARLVADPIQARVVVPSAVELAGWDYLVSVPATTDDVYEVVVPTLINGAGNLSTFFVRATRPSPGLYYDSPQAQGYSLDNLPPAPPTPLVGNYSAGATHLSWGENLEPDLAYYRLYRGASAGFVPGPGNLVAATSALTFDDVGGAGSYYKLSATDVNGNESGFTLLTPQATLGAEGGAPVAFALQGARPNPARGDRLDVWFSLPGAAPARLELFDVGGRRVASREVGALGPGLHHADLGEGRTLPGGLYVIRLTQGGATRTARAIVLE